MKIGDHSILSQISTKDWAVVAKRLAVPGDVAMERLTMIQHNIVDAYRQAIDELPAGIGVQFRQVAQRIVGALAEVTEARGWAAAKRTLD